MSYTERISSHITPTLILVAASIVSILFFYHLAFTDMILARGDTFSYFYPYWDARNAALRAGQLPLWNPDIFMGVPLLANPQLGTFYPPNWLTIPLTAPDGIRYSILLHVVWATLGMLLCFRRLVASAWLPALTAAFTFALGGYVGGHVEQINQLQGIAWLPWLLYLCHRMLTDTHPWRYGLLLAIGWALQLFSGHTQTVFMSGIALGILTLFTAYQQRGNHPYFTRMIKSLFMLAGITFVTVLLAIPQLLPALELTGMSNRGSGLNAQEATAFSLPPHYVGRALLPSYDGQLFTEYVAYVGIAALALAIIGALMPALPSENKHPSRYLWLTLIIIGVLFALGRFNPLYVLLADLPGFNLFRVPSRWLALYSLGIAMLAGRGLLTLQHYALTTQKLPWRPLFIAIGIVLSLGLIGIFAPINPVDIVGPAQPTVITLLGWGIALIAFVVALWISIYRRMPIVLLVVIVIELFLASRVLPHTELVPRDVYLGQRFTISQMLAFTDDTTVPPRTLAISARLFDVGDIAAIRERYAMLGMDAEAQATAATALKSQEVLFPNLSMTWGIPTIDGYGGGLLPTIYYSQFTSLLLPADSDRTADGRIGEMLTYPACRGACVPDMHWLHMLDTSYLITDKNFDVVHDGIFYDTSLAEYWLAPPNEPDFIYDSVHVLCLSEPTQGDVVTFDFQGSTYYRAMMPWQTMTTHFDTLCENLLAITVVETVTNTFLQLMPPNIERVLSSDIKIYRLTLPTERARLITEMIALPDDWAGHEAALSELAASPETTVIHNAPLRSGTEGGVTITDYSATRITLDVTAESESYITIADAYYPGWQATVNGAPAPVYRADVMFRAVPVPAGESEIIVTFVPRLWYRALWAGCAAWILASVLLVASFLRIRE